MSLLAAEVYKLKGLSKVIDAVKRYRGKILCITRITETDNYHGSSEGAYHVVVSVSKSKAKGLSRILSRLTDNDLFDDEDDEDEDEG